MFVWKVRFFFRLILFSNRTDFTQFQSKNTHLFAKNDSEYKNFTILIYAPISLHIHLLMIVFTCCSSIRRRILIKDKNRCIRKIDVVTLVTIVKNHCWWEVTRKELNRRVALGKFDFAFSSQSLNFKFAHIVQCNFSTNTISSYVKSWFKCSKLHSELFWISKESTS